MIDVLILVGYVAIIAGFYYVANRVFGRGEIEIPEQRRHEHRHILHRKNK